MTSAASRLDRLVTLLDKGSTQLIRNTAATQLADIQKQNPDSLFSLLSRVLPYLQSKTWDTRTAAAKAIGGILENATVFEPNGDEAELDSELKDEQPVIKPEIHSDRGVRLCLDTLDINLVLQYGRKLLGSGSKTEQDTLKHLTPGDRVARQQQSLHARLGLRGKLLSDVDVDVDVETDRSALGPKANGQKAKVARTDSESKKKGKALQAASVLPSSDNKTMGNNGLSTRQLYMLKRKQKSSSQAGSSKMRVVDLGGRKPSDSPSLHESVSPHPLRIKSPEESEDGIKKEANYFSVKQEGEDDITQLVKEFKGEPIEEKPFIVPAEESSNDWPLKTLCEYLSMDLFDGSWEIRHGAAMGLREILRTHGHGAGRRYASSRRDNDTANRAWLENMVCELLCVLMLDRFGDYVADTVVAPIRESVGQTFGAVLPHLPTETALSTYRVLQKMIYQTEVGRMEQVWQVCHGGMLGLRYFVAIRRDLLLQYDEIMDGVIHAVTTGLGHNDDDVKSVSAATLVPISQELTKLRQTALGSVISVVWDCLLDMQDDLSASTGAVMDLLANLCTYPEVLQAMQNNAQADEEQSFSTLVPRLFPFLRHTITSVRLSVLKALMRFLQVAENQPAAWIDARVIRLIYQNILVERSESVLKLSYEVFQGLVNYVENAGFAAYSGMLSPILKDMIAADIQPVGQSRYPIPMDKSLFIKPSGAPMALSRNGSEPPAKKRKHESSPDESQNSSHNTDGHIMSGDIDLVSMETILRTRIYASQALGKLLALQKSSQVEHILTYILSAADSRYASTKLFAAMLLEEVVKNCKEPLMNTGDLAQQIITLIEKCDEIWYADIVSSLQAARGQCQSLLAAFANNAQVPRNKLPVIAIVCQGEETAGPNAFSLADADKIISSEYDRLLNQLTPAQRITAPRFLNDARASASDAINEARKTKARNDVYVKSALGAALIALKQIPKKPGVLVKCVMESVKLEQNLDLQLRSARAVASLIAYYTEQPKPGPRDKIVENLVKFTCVDTSETPEYIPNAALRDVVLSMRKDEDKQDHVDRAKFEQDQRDAKTMRRGARQAIKCLANMYGANLFAKIPVLLTLIEAPLKLLGDSEQSICTLNEEEGKLGQNLVDAFSLLRTISPYLDHNLQPWLFSNMSSIQKGIRHQLSVIRYAAAKCFATVCSVVPSQGVAKLVEDILPNIGNALELTDRQGITETVYHLIHAMGDDILPYVIFLIVPVLGRMSDSNEEVRLLATTSFATLVKLVPLEAGIQDPPGMSKSLLEGRDRERKFMAQMLDPKKAEPFQIPVAIKAELRSYQQDGVNWLAFLNRFGLHGVLCDDMGLGKTLQTICIVASDHHNRAEEFKKTQAPDKRKLASLIVCPPTLSGHWQQELKQYAPFLTVVAYVGPPAARSAARPHLENADIVITSYDVCRNDNDVLAPLSWNYCVLDEGHLIKNPKAKITQSVKRLQSNHRLILSGTPIQNNVLELWSLFDFLMPGFLGFEKTFQERYAKPIAQSRNAKSSSKEQEAGALAVEGLHKQVLPFLLRRLKEEVLNDLPPKILQNYYCDLSDLQKRLFEDFFKKEKKVVEGALGAGDKESKQHIFQALQYMRKLCNSPAMVVKENHAQYAKLQQELASKNSSLKDIVHAPKLGALKDLLIDCGIGVQRDPNDLSTGSDYVSPHRALIFCQMKEMLDMVQTEVFAKSLPSAQFMRLDGSVEATRRQDIVNKFNNDPSYDCLLLTTSVGGLGLNLTGADTVIFVEHDWNPQKDIQAMDRAHRLGQKKTVNVYRLITRGTLEEKIMGLQRFKIDVASTVVNQQNAGLGTMETDQILDLFSLGEGADGSSVPGLEIPAKANGSNGDDRQEEDMVDHEGNVLKKGEKGFLNDIGELWDERQYEEEFNLDSFLQKMQK